MFKVENVPLDGIFWSCMTGFSFIAGLLSHKGDLNVYFHGFVGAESENHTKNNSSFGCKSKFWL